MKKIIGLLVLSVLLGQWAYDWTTSPVTAKFDGYVRPGSVYHAYGGFEDKSATVVVDSEGWTTVTSAGDLFAGSEADGFALSSDTLRVAFSGDIAGVVSLTFLGSNTKNFDFRIYNITQARQEGYKFGVTGRGGDYTSICFPVYIEATANDDIILQVYGVDTGDDITAKHGMFYLTELHR